jgi:hypothetical protein
MLCKASGSTSLPGKPYGRGAASPASIIVIDIGGTGIALSRQAGRLMVGTFATRERAEAFRLISEVAHSQRSGQPCTRFPILSRGGQPGGDRA